MPKRVFLEEQQQLAFYATLASIPDLAQRPQWEQMKLVEDAKTAGFRFARISNAYQHLEAAHAKIHVTINTLLDGKPLHAYWIHKEGALLKVAADEAMAYEYDGNELTGTLLVLLLSSPSCPFRRCAACSQVVFVPVKRQRFCSPRCTYLGYRNENKEKTREYMRVYMAKRRNGGVLPDQPKKRGRPIGSLNGKTTAA